ncbi:SH3 domain-containing protein [Streptomyces sp. NPDC050534]|uniref:SH3 domain-containing protein n=1 Tax=Streptomyces sp. NPDC050534 TaxID=3365625 RepID=UPI0037897E7A
MSLRTLLTRVAITTAAGALITSVAVAPALADDDWDGGGGDSSAGSAGSDQHDGWDQGGDQGGDQHHSQGVVTAGELLLRSAPNRGSQVIRVVHRGQRVSIFCKTPGQSVQGNNLWYLLTDGTWAWGSARYIETIGTPPRWC